jgi:hypothetical protein
MFTWPEFFFLKKGAPLPAFIQSTIQVQRMRLAGSSVFNTSQKTTRLAQNIPRLTSQVTQSKPMISLQSFDVITWRPRHSLRSYPSCLQRAPTSPVATHLVSYSPRFSFLANLHSLPPPFSFLPSVTPKNRTCSSSSAKLI